MAPHKITIKSMHSSDDVNISRYDLKQLRDSEYQGLHNIMEHSYTAYIWWHCFSVKSYIYYSHLNPSSFTLRYIES